MSTPALTALISTTNTWPEAEPVLDALVADVAPEGDRVEVMVADGTPGGDAVPDGHYPGIKIERLGPIDVFECRAAGLRRSTGAAVSLIEDHLVVLPGWTTALLQGLDEHPDAAVLVGSMVNGTPDTLLDRAAYAFTLGPFDRPVAPFVRDRMPVPANLTVRRSHLPPDFAPGWVEYSAPLAAFDEGGLARVPEAVCEHVQHFDGIEGITIKFHSGRAYGGALRGHSPRDKLQHVASRGRFATTVYRTSKRGLGPSPSVTERLALVAMLATHVTGQVVGLATGPGRSREAMR